MPPLEPPSGHYEHPDERELAAFLVGVRNVLGIFVEHSHVLMPPFMREHFGAAWPDVQNAVEDSYTMLQVGPDRRFRRHVPDELLKLTPEQLHERLELFGLTGSHLQLKLSIFWHYYDAVMSDPPFVSVIQASGPTATVGRFKLWSMRKLLEIINSMLGSLSRVLSIVDIVKEFKEAAEHGYDLGQPGS